MTFFKEGMLLNSVMPIVPSTLENQISDDCYVMRTQLRVRHEISKPLLYDEYVMIVVTESPKTTYLRRVHLLTWQCN